jgi:hypothetical protein
VRLTTYHPCSAERQEIRGLNLTENPVGLLGLSVGVTFTFTRHIFHELPLQGSTDYADATKYYEIRTSSAVLPSSSMSHFPSCTVQAPASYSLGTGFFFTKV